MSFDQAIKSGKEHRKPYSRTKSGYRCNCQGCQKIRRQSYLKQLEEMNQQLDEYGLKKAKTKCRYR